MEARDLYYIASLLVMAISGIVWVNNALKDGKNATDLLHVKLKTNIENLNELKSRLNDHEEKIDERLTKMNEKIDHNHKEITDTLSDIKVAIERIKK